MSDENKRRIHDANTGSGTLISEGCKIKGEISGRGNFMINGEIDGECDIEGTVTLAKGGFWRGIIRADSIIVTGTVEGEIHASGGVEIGDTARISGSVSGDRLRLRRAQSSKG